MNSSSYHKNLRRHIRATLNSRFTIDSRALAAFRVGLGCVLILDVLLRLRNLRTFYTDAGVLPVSQLAEQSPLLARFSLHAQSGDAWFQFLLFTISGTVAVALVIGYKTRLATFVSLGLLLSLHARNPHVLSGGDALLQHLLAWSLFLPLGRRWSVDARQHEPSQNHALSMATAGILIQVVLVYATNAILKTRSEEWLSGDATATVLGLDRFTILLGPLLREVPFVLDLFHWVWLTLLLISPLLVVTTGQIRAVLVGAFATMHLGMLLTLYLGIFPLVTLVALIPFLQSDVWNALSRIQIARGLSSRLDGTIGVAARLLPTWSPTRPIVRGETPRRIGQSVIAVGLVGVILFNAFAIGVVPIPAPATDTISAEQTEPRWTMFASNPTETDRWFVAPGNLSTGDRIDAFNQGDVEWHRPDHIASTYSSSRMRDYMANLRYDERLQQSFATYLCERWNRTHDVALLSVSVYAVETTNAPSEDGPAERIELVNTSCTTSQS